MNIQDIIQEFESKFGRGVFDDDGGKLCDHEKIKTWLTSKLQSAYSAGKEEGKAGEALAQSLDHQICPNCGRCREEGFSAGEASMKEKVKDLAEALAGMYEQYCDEGHKFMSAGEHASLILEQYHLGKFDDGGRGEIDWEAIERLALPLTHEDKEKHD